MRFFLVLFLSVLPAAAQVPKARIVHATLSYQPGMAQSLARLAFTGYTVTVCSTDSGAIDVPGGLITQGAEQQGVQPVNLLVASLAATQKRAKSGLQVAANVGAEVLYTVALLGGANIPKVNLNTLLGKAYHLLPIWGAHEMAAYNAQLALIQPDPVGVFAASMLDPTAKVSIPAGACVQKLILAANGGPKGAAFDVALNTSVLMSDEQSIPPLVKQSSTRGVDHPVVAAAASPNTTCNLRSDGIFDCLSNPKAIAAAGDEALLRGYSDSEERATPVLVAALVIP